MCVRLRKQEATLLLLDVARQREPSQRPSRYRPPGVIATSKPSSDSIADRQRGTSSNLTELLSTRLAFYMALDGLSTRAEMRRARCLYLTRIRRQLRLPGRSSR